jgi:hypothetical protein
MMRDLSGYLRFENLPAITFSLREKMSPTQRFKGLNVGFQASRLTVCGLGWSC